MTKPVCSLNPLFVSFYNIERVVDGEKIIKPLYDYVGLFKITHTRTLAVQKRKYET